MADSRIRYILSAVDGASAVFGRVGQAMDGLREDSAKMGGLMREAFGFDIGATDIVRGAFDLGRELNQIGMEANVLESNFSELANEIGGADVVMEAMRSATGGVIGNMQLMTAANSLMLTGIATSADSLAEMSAGAIKLGAAMGQDAAGSLENFNSAMLNMSYERLDTLGVSASAVRERVNELKEAGIEAGDAFQTAVLEQMEVSLNRLGDAVTASETSITRLATRFENFQQEVGQFVNEGLESGAMLIEIGVVLVEQQQSQRQEQASIEATAEVLGATYAQRFVDSFETTLNQEDIASVMSSVLADGSASMQDVVLGTGNVRLADRFMAGDTGTMDQIAHAMQYALTLENERLATVNAINDAQAEAVRQTESYNAAAERAADAYINQLNTMHDIAEEQGQIDQVTERSVVAWGDILNLSRGALREYNGMTVATAEAAASAEALAFETEQAYLQAQNIGLEGEALDSFKQARDEARGIADDFARASENLQTMDLATALGSGRDATQNMLRDVLEIAGVSERASGLATGDISLEQARFEDEVAPILQAITQQMGDDAGVLASKRFTDSYTAALNQGLGAAQALEQAKQAIGYELGAGAGDGFTVAFGDTVSGLALEHGLTQEQVMQMLGIDDPSQLMAGMVAEMQAELQRITTEPDSERGVGGFVEDAGVLLTDDAGDDAGAAGSSLEERSALLTDMRNTLFDMSEVPAPDLSSAAMGLDSSVNQAGVLASSLSGLERTYRVSVVYDIEVNGTAPAGAPGPMTQVPISSGET